MDSLIASILGVTSVPHVRACCMPHKRSLVQPRLAFERPIALAWCALEYTNWKTSVRVNRMLSRDGMLNGF